MLCTTCDEWAHIGRLEAAKPLIPQVIVCPVVSVICLSMIISGILEMESGPSLLIYQPWDCLDKSRNGPGFCFLSFDQIIDATLHRLLVGPVTSQIKYCVHPDDSSVMMFRLCFWAVMQVETTVISSYLSISQDGIQRMQPSCAAM